MKIKITKNKPKIKRALKDLKEAKTDVIKGRVYKGNLKELAKIS